MSTGLRAALGVLGLNGKVSVPSQLCRPRPASLRALLRAGRDPKVAGWNLTLGPWGTNTDWSEEAQGFATDGNLWYVATNADDGDEALYALSRKTVKVVKRLAPPYDPDDYHTGALCVRGQTVLVAVQGPSRGVWVTNTDLSTSSLAHADHLPAGDMFAWCDLNPHNGLVYTANFSSPDTLFAYQLKDGALLYRPDADIPIIGASDGSTTRVQGACFTPNFKLLAVCDVADAEQIHCFSTLTGRLLGRRLLLAETDDIGVGYKNELESIWFEPEQQAVHVLELDNDVHSNDDAYLWRLDLPSADLL